MIFVLGAASFSQGNEVETISFKSGELVLKGYLCKPRGSGPFPLVIYNHGGVGDIIGGAPRETCLALARAGYVGFAPIRRTTRSMQGHLDDVLAGLDYARRIEKVDAGRIAMIGFSRGSFLTYMAGIKRSELKALIIMAAAVNSRSEQLLDNATAITAPVLALVAKNDTGSKTTMGRNTLDGMGKIKVALEEADKDVQLIVYPPYGNDGHAMFFKIGTYWKDVLRFLNEKMSG